ncbi:TlpA family protein disulfide reductase [Lysinimonas soli]|uniref:TlpA family protein disulfide reductase n=1 Tax=Lysinimonas soli TaxID=1074233 RepID=A0ABW0NQ61_9MICO
MQIGTVVIVLASLVLAATVIGVLQRSLSGRVRIANHRSPGIDGAVDIRGVALGGRATLLQFSSEVCTPCVATARVLGDIARATDSVAHIDLDVAERPELAARFRVMQTPTTLILDGTGAVRARIGGAVRRELLVAELDRVLAGPVLAA